MGRGRVPLSTPVIVDTAVRIVESEGADAVSMRRLAAELGTAPASLYRHVAGREALLQLVSDAILGAVDLPDDPSAPWQDRTATYAYAVRRALARHRGRALFVLGPDSPAPEAFHLFARGRQVYLDAGFPPELALAAVQSVVFLVRSFAALEAEPSTSIVVPPGSLAPPTGDRFAEAREVDGPDAERDEDELFDFLLAALIDALERQFGAVDRG
jgi:AcrR family transcriptional regulator